jgi:farnesyl-diphosphate farnesyltransferase
MSQHDELQTLLEKTSRTFALSIPLLPEPTRREVGTAYLLFRIADTLEDATLWSPEQRIRALLEFRELLASDRRDLGEQACARWCASPPVAQDGYLELLAAMPRVLDWYRALDSSAISQIELHAGRSATRMAQFVQRMDGQGGLCLSTMADLSAYCLAVAGIVGQMLTELFLKGRPELAGVAAGLRERALSFGEGLQLVNILKDASSDRAAGRVYLPSEVPLREVFDLARRDLRRAEEYNQLLRAACNERGLWAFNALNAGLAVACLNLLSARGLDSKLTREQVTSLHARVLHAAERDLPLTGELPA